MADKLLRIGAVISTRPLSRAAAEDERHVDPARDGDIAARTLSEHTERERLSCPYPERGPGQARRAVELRRQFGAGYRDGGVGGEAKLWAHESGFEPGIALIVADQQIGGA